MKSFSVILIVVLVKSSVKGFNVDVNNVTCGGAKLDVEKHMVGMKECLDLSGVKDVTDLGPMDAGCFFKCIMEKKGVIQDGKPHKENVMKAIDANLPAAVAEKWKTEMEKCLENEGKEIKSPDDDSCSTYLPLAMCTHLVFTNICS